MAKKTYRLNYGTHQIPNPDFKLNPDGTSKEGISSHLEVKKGDHFVLDEERAEAFLQRFGTNEPKFTLVSDSAHDKLGIVKTGSAADRASDTNDATSTNPQPPAESPQAPEPTAPKAAPPGAKK
jgi:hypothetical protein